MVFLDFLTTSAVSLVIGGNTGINACLTLFLMGCIERYDPTLINMEGTMETLLASWPGLIVLGVASLLEFIGNCVPVLDQIIESAMTFVVPIMSVLGSLSPFGLFDQLATESSDQGNRQLGNGGSGFIVFFQVILVLSGVLLALSLHLFKMFVRLLGEGCCTGLMTALEVMWTFCTVFLVIFIKPIAIVVAIFLCFAAVRAVRRKLAEKKKKQQEEEEDGVIVEANVAVVEEGYVKMEGAEQDKEDGRPVSPVTKEEGDVVVIEQGKGYKSMDESKV